MSFVVKVVCGKPV
ncbi:hypothetical protein M2G44_22330 [Vibrio vulnificus]|nr:hypothetical protein [Vibrio vulnificus]MCU8335213.1 hypothetical protein [Vibrio vulnificus]MCU8413279.1 hypothetical protein [Vibrio vulnificus]